ncbi:MAG: glycosyl transferase [Burkholderiales bacterium]|jgi:UDP-N-acetylmuramyl pentapeptide phosphotransferase/UDP-N-acetylglucosamine-1-phosphate transferase
MAKLLPALIAAAVAGIALACLLRTGRLPVDRPNPRSLHRDAVPRGGGLAIWLGWCAGIAWLPGPRPWLLPLLAIVIVSLIDDWRGMPLTLRLFVQLAAALAWLWLAGPVPEVPVAAVTIVAIVWMSNLYNFMDGSDGLAGTMTLVGFGAYALAASWAGSERAPVLLALAAAVAPFLLANWPRARIFLGDAGAVPLGFLAGVFGIEGCRQGWWPAWFPLLVFLPFIADATATLLRRLLRGQRIWEAHRDHYYQRLVRLGFGHAGTLALYGALMIGTAVSALAALSRAPQTGLYLLVEWGAVLALLFWSIGQQWRSRIGSLDDSKR